MKIFLIVGEKNLSISQIQIGEKSLRRRMFILKEQKNGGVKK
jgi:hypothetical protein